jgi:DNA polymerase
MKKLQIKKLIQNIINEDIRDYKTEVLITEDDLKVFNQFGNTDNLLQNLKDKFQNCQNCDLSKTRKNIVFGEGCSSAKLMLITESPWKEEDEKGQSFIGEKGNLLTKIIEAINLTREEIYITNLVKCFACDEITNERRAPNNEEKDACIKILQKQISIINPKIICTLGNTATKYLLNTEEEITDLRGKVFKYKNHIVVPTLHPAYLLREPSSKKLVWEDVKKIKNMLEENILE